MFHHSWSNWNFVLSSQMTHMFGMDDDYSDDAILGRLEGMKDVIEQVNQQFKDPVRFFRFVMEIKYFIHLHKFVVIFLQI